MSENPALDSLPLAERIDAVCDRFENDWHSGTRPKIEEYLAAAPDSDRPELLRALLPVELELRSQAGQQPPAEEYCGRFPTQSDLVRECFAEFLASPQGASPGQTISVSSPAADTSVPSSVASAPTKPLEKLGRFQILKVLGEGAFGTVYQARDPDLDRPVAIKVPREGVLKTPDDRQRFRREARAAASLSHPNICPVYEVGAADGHDYIVMGYIDGRPLSSFIHSGKVQARQAASVVRKLASALDEAHREGIVHRDLKPANIMINSRGEPVVMDFGLARLHGPGDAQITASGAIMGSPAYMSPEQARGDTAAVGPASDIYSLGVILYELLAGRRPFQGTVTEVIGQILHVEPAPPSAHRENVDPRLEAICCKAISKRPEDRYGTMRELAQALADYLKTSAAAAHVTDVSAQLTASGLPSHAKQPGRRHTRLIPLLTTGLALAALAAWGGLWFFARTETVTVQIHIPVDTKDPALRFLLDERRLPATQLGPPIELKPGEHELVVEHDGQIFKHFLLIVGKKNNQISVQDITPKAVVAAGPTPAKAAEADKQAAEWVLGLGGRVIVRGDQQPISEVDRLPSTPYKVREILLAGKHFPDDQLARLSVLTALQRLELHGTQVSDQGLAHLGSLQGLRYLNLDGSRATDDGLALLKGLSGLEELYLDGSRDISAAGVAHLRGLTALEALGLSGTAMTDRGLEIVKHLPRLRILRLDHTDITDAGLEHLAGHLQLYELGLGVTGVTGPGLLHLKSLPRLWHLSIAGPQTTDATLKVVGELTQLESLALHQSPRIADDGLQHIKALTNLRRLALHETRISDAGLEHLRGLTFLTELSLQQTRVTAAGVARLKAAVPECYIATSLPGSDIKVEVTPKPVLDTPPAVTANAGPDADRRAAEWVLRIGGQLKIFQGDRGWQVPRVEELPAEPFRVIACWALSNKNVSDDGLKALSGLTGSLDLNFDNTAISNAGLAHLKDCKGIWALHLCDTKISDDGLKHLSGLTKLTELWLHDTPLTGAGLVHLKALPALDALGLRGTKISDDDLQHLQALPLGRLDLTNTNVTDVGLPHLKAHKKLVHLNVQKTKVTAAGVAEFKAAVPNCKELLHDFASPGPKP